MVRAIGEVMDGVRHGAPDESAAVRAVDVTPVVETSEVREAVEQFAAFLRR